ncbi:MAG: CotH kinase family protein [Anaerolineaceae bacterium]|nr:CotH kinase family protein [Anaerolineaceae bacterium]
MKISQEQKQNKNRNRFHKLAGLISKFFHQPIVIVMVMIGIMMVSLIAGVYLYKAGVLTNIKSAFTDMSIETHANIQRELSPYIDNDLSTLYLDIAFDDYQTLSIKRDTALSAGVLLSSDEDYVPGKIHLDDETSQRIELRLKGDWTDHLAGDKWSFRIHMKGDGQIFGMRTFSLQAPETREYLDEWAYHQYLLQEGIMTTHYYFVNVIINGEPKGIYALEESFAEELIESEERRQGVLLRFDEDDMWENTYLFHSHGIALNGAFWITDLSTAKVSLFREGTVYSDETLSQEAKTAITLIRGFQQDSMSADEVFDVDMMGKFYAASDLWAGMHGTAWHNMRFYYNPITGYLEPVMYDGNALSENANQNTRILDFTSQKLFAHPEVRAAYAKYILEFTEPEAIDSFIEKTSDAFYMNQSALEKEYFTLAESEILESPWYRVRKRAEMLRLQFEVERPVWGTVTPVWLDNLDRKGSYLELDLQNQYLIPMKITSINVNGIEQSIQTDMIDIKTSASFYPADKEAIQLLPTKDWYQTKLLLGRIYVPFDISTFDQINSNPVLSVEIAGTNIEKQIPLSAQQSVDDALSEFRPEIPEVDEVLASHPYIRQVENEPMALEIVPGEWSVRKDLILPKGYSLTATSGTTLKFADDVILFTTGALFFEGTEDAPVILKPINEKWPGLVVIRAEEESTLSHVIIQDTASIQRGGWILTGGITFYESPIKLDNVIIDGTFAEDSINVIRTEFNFYNSQFRDTFSDAFDSDFSDGLVSGCLFKNVGGDAIDISGSLTEVYDSKFIAITDKAVSVGEHSSILVQDVEINDIGIGIASKDLSSATLLRVTISGAQNAALAAYQKKPVFGPANIFGEEVTVTDCERTSIIQVDSEAVINGSTLETIDQTFDDLFNQGLLGS